MLQTTNKTLTDKCEQLTKKNELLSTENTFLKQELNKLALKVQVLEQGKCSQQKACRQFRGSLAPYGLIFSQFME